jgi:hypothetical protein
MVFNMILSNCKFKYQNTKTISKTLVKKKVNQFSSALKLFKLCFHSFILVLISSYSSPCTSSMMHNNRDGCQRMHFSSRGFLMSHLPSVNSGPLTPQVDLRCSQVFGPTNPSDQPSNVASGTCSLPFLSKSIC